MAEPLLPELPWLARKELKRIVASFDRHPVEILDVGGRKSHYTIGLPAKVRITELPRVSTIQHQLNLGLTPELQNQVYRRRSNVVEVIFDDMTTSHVPDKSADVVVAIEVLEHVNRDRDFVNSVARVLRPDGVFFMTTPNGDHVPNTNPDHVRHYSASNLQELLESSFHEVSIGFRVKSGPLHRASLSSWGLYRPLRTFVAMSASLLHKWQAAWTVASFTSHNTCHLVVTARRPHKQ